MQPQRFLVDGRDVARDHAALFQQLDPAMAGRHRQPDLVGEFLHGHAAVGLQQAQDLAVDGVEGRHWYELVDWRHGSWEFIPILCGMSQELRFSATAAAANIGDT